MAFRQASYQTRKTKLFTILFCCHFNISKTTQSVHGFIADSFCPDRGSRVFLMQRSRRAKRLVSDMIGPRFDVNGANSTDIFFVFYEGADLTFVDFAPFSLDFVPAILACPIIFYLASNFSR